MTAYPGNAAATSLLERPDRSQMVAEALHGLSSTPKSLPCKYFYDARGSYLFEAITRLDEYYVTRAETDLMETHSAEIAAAIGPRATLVEYGSGSSRKTRLLLDALREVASYVPVDISGDFLRSCARSLQAEYPGLDIVPLEADFTAPFDVPVNPDARRTVVYFPGSTIGNFEWNAARVLLAQMARQGGNEGGVLIGVDLDKDRSVLEAAYNDESGTTAEFNLNILTRLNRDIGTNFEVDRFTHRATYNAAESRIEMNLISMVDQRVSVDGQSFDFVSGEGLVTEYSHKYSPGRFRRLAGEAGLAPKRMWTDSAGLFSVWYLEPRRLSV